MKPRSLIIVGCVFLLVVAWVAARSMGLFKPRKKADLLANRLVLDTKLGELTKIEIAPREGRTLQLVKVAGVWRIAQPIDAKADSAAVESLAASLQDLRFDRAVVSDGPDAESEDMTGLKKPAWTVRLQAGAAKAEIAVGRALPGLSASYARIGKDAGVVPGDLAKLVGRSAVEFRDKKVLRLDEGKIARMTLTTGAGNLELARGKDQTWSILAPASAPADQEAVNKIVRAVSNLTAVEFVPGKGKPLEAYGLTGTAVQAKVRIEMKPEAPATAPASSPATASAPASKPAPKEGAVYTLVLGAKGQTNVYARLEGGEEIFFLPPDLLETLRPDVQALRRKRLLDVAPAEVDALMIGKARLEKKAWEWLVREPVAGKADFDAVEKYVRTVCDLEAEKFADEASPLSTYGLDTPAAVIQLRLKDKTVTVLVGSRGDSTGKKRFVKLADGKAVAVLAAEKVIPLTGEYWTLWDTKLWRTPEGGTIATLQVARDGATVELAGRGAAWSMVKPVAGAVDLERVNKLLDRLRLLRADGIAAFPAVPETMRQAKDHVVIRLGVELPVPAAAPASRPASAPATASAPAPAPAPAPEKEVRTYTFHVVRAAGKVCAWVEGGPVTPVGEFPEAFYADMTAELRDRTLARITPDLIKQVRITRGADVSELVRADTGWRYTAGKYVDMDPDKIREFLQDFAAVKADRFAAYVDPGTFGVAQAAWRVELTDTKGQVTAMSLSDRGPVSDGRYAAVTGVQGVVVISADDVKKLDKTWKDFEKPAKPGTTDKPEAPEMP